MKPKALVLLLVAVIAVVVLAIATKRDEAPPRPGTTVGLDAPVFTVYDVKGSAAKLPEMKGTVVFVNFWASWCQPCKEEMPAVQALYRKFKDEPRFRMVTILYRDDYERATAFMKQSGYDFPVYLDPNSAAASAYGVTGVPETYVVTKKGILKEKVIGPADWSSPQVLSAISGLLTE